MFISLMHKSESISHNRPITNDQPNPKTQTEGSAGDLSAELTFFLVIALCSVCALTLASLALRLAQHLHLMPPLLPGLPPASPRDELMRIMCINSLSIALSVTSYYNLCTSPTNVSSVWIARTKHALCVDLPLNTRVKPMFQGLVFQATGSWFPEVKQRPLCLQSDVPCSVQAAPN